MWIYQLIHNTGDNAETSTLVPLAIDCQKVILTHFCRLVTDSAVEKEEDIKSGEKIASENEQAYS